MRAPHLHSFPARLLPRRVRSLARELASGAELPFAFEEHATRRARRSTSTGRSCAASSRAGAGRCCALSDTRARDRRSAARAGGRDLRARPRGRRRRASDEALFRAVLLPLLAATAERCGGFDWNDDGVRRRVRRARADALRDERAPTPRVAPLVGLAAGSDGRARRRHPRPARRRRRDLRTLWPEARGLDAAGVRARRRPAVRARAAARARCRRRPTPPDAPGRARRRRDRAPARDRRGDRRRPRRLRAARLPAAADRPVLPIAATQPPGEATRLDAFRGGLARALRARLACSPTTTASSREALDRWELSLFPGSRSGRSSCARRSRRCSAAETGLGRGAAGWRCCSARTAASEPSC